MISLRKLEILIVGICILFTLVACNQNSSSDWYDTKEEAVEIGLQEEGINETVGWSAEEYENETIVFYDHKGDLGVASITESEKGYRWFRSSPYFGFDVTGDLPYTTAGFNYETETGLLVPILYGQIFDDSVQSGDLENLEGVKGVKMLGNSNIFFTFLEAPLEEFNNTPKK